MPHIPETVAERSRDQGEGEDLPANPSARPPLTLRGLREGLRATLGDRKDTHLHLFLLAPEIDLDFAISVLDTGATIAENEPDNDLEKWTARYASAEEVLEVLESLEDPEKVRAAAYERASAFAMSCIGQVRTPTARAALRNLARQLRDAAGSDARLEVARDVRPAEDEELLEALAAGIESGRALALRLLQAEEARLRTGIWTTSTDVVAKKLEEVALRIQQAENPAHREAGTPEEAALRISLLSSLALLALAGLDASRAAEAERVLRTQVLPLFRSESSVSR